MRNWEFGTTTYVGLGNFRLRKVFLKNIDKAKKRREAWFEVPFEHIVFKNWSLHYKVNKNSIDFYIVRGQHLRTPHKSFFLFFYDKLRTFSKSKTMPTS